MAAITLSMAQAKLTAAMEAYESALKSASFSTSTDSDSFSASNQSLSELQDAVDYWEKRVMRLSRRGGIKTRRIVRRG